MSMTSHLMSALYQFPPVPVRRFTGTEYHNLITSGLFASDERFELLDGWITPKMSRNPPHDFVLDLVKDVIPAHASPGWRFRIQSAITLSNSEPEPDLTVAIGPAQRYHTRHPLSR